MPDFMPHAQCINYDTWIIVREVTGNIMTAIAYYVIPVGLWKIGRHIETNKQIKAFMFMASLFIFSCGNGHILDIITLWIPVYRFESWWKLGTGIISVMTAAMISPEIIPKVSKKV